MEVKYIILYIFLSFVALFMMLGLHKIEEGHIGVYFRGGALLPETSSPGYNVMFPFITSYENVQVTVQTDKVKNIPCGTSGGVVIHFDNVEVVNRLMKSLAWETIRNYTVNYDKTWIFDKIHHEINQFCSKHTLQEVYITLFDRLDDDLIKALQRDCNIWAPGIEIISIRVTKPRIPPEITANYERMEMEKIKQKIALEQQRISETFAETKRLEATINAQLESDVSILRMEKELNETKIQSDKEFITNSMLVERESAMATATKIRLLAEAEANKAKLSPQFLKLETLASIGNSTKFYFGDSMARFVEENIYQMKSMHSGLDKNKI